MLHLFSDTYYPVTKIPLIDYRYCINKLLFFIIESKTIIILLYTVAIRKFYRC